MTNKFVVFYNLIDGTREKQSMSSTDISLLFQHIVENGFNGAHCWTNQNELRAVDLSIFNYVHVEET